MPSREASLPRGSAREDAPPTQGEPVPGGDPPVSADLSALLVELARIPEVELDIDASWAPDPKVGDVVGRFVLQRELGRGGFGVVYEALDRELGRAVAFKSVRPGRRVEGRSESWLRAEAEAVARLNHPNIITLHDFGRGPHGPYLIFELLRGETLADRLQGGPRPLRDAVDVAVDVARVLAHAHAAGVVHRDLTPGNVFLCQDGTVKVLDFGLAHLFGRAGPNGGTPAYMAPEQWRDAPGDARTDLFALGVLLHHMLSGAAPYRVSRERSEALEPGPPPSLPRRAAPAPLRRLTARLLEKDPAGRPRSAQEVLDVLLPLQRRLRRAPWSARRRALVALASAALVAGGALVARSQRPMSGAPVVVAVADVENGTGERDLDGLSGLLITSLEQSRRFEVLTRSRLVGLLGRIGRSDAARIDEPLARELARVAGAGVVLVASVRRADDHYAFEVRGLDPGARRLFSVEERAPAKAGVLGAVDRLSDSVRRALRERSEHLRDARIQVAQAVTSSLEAYQAYFEGLDCWDRPSRRSWAEAGGCTPHFREALARDPAFALAHYQLAFILHTEGRPAADVDVHLQAALRSLERAPPKEAALVRAWADYVAGRHEEALAAYGRLLQAHPDEKQALYVSSHVLSRRGRWAEAVPYLQRLLEVDPYAEWPLDDLVTALAMLRRWDALRELATGSSDEPATPARRHARVRALVWLGDLDGALEAARDAVARGDGAPAELDLASVRVARGDVEEAERVLERAWATQPSDFQTVFALARVVSAQGRRREALALVDRLASGAETQDQGVVQYARAVILAGDAEPEVLRREVAKAQALAPGLSGSLAAVLALRGDLARAAELARDLEDGSTAAEEHAAMVGWRRGDAPGAISRLTALELRDPWPYGPIPPAFLLAEVSAATGDWAGTLAAVERYRALWPRGLWPAWALPRSAYLAALAHAELGDVEAARAELGRVRRLWRRADPGLPLFRDLRELEVRLGR